MIEQNVKATQLANELMDLGQQLAKESGVDANTVRLFWLRVAESANTLTGDRLLVPASASVMEVEGHLPSDDDQFPFGKHKGERYSDVPDHYFRWLSKQEWIGEWPDVLLYIQENELD